MRMGRLRERANRTRRGESDKGEFGQTLTGGFGEAMASERTLGINSQCGRSGPGSWAEGESLCASAFQS